jgi:outer membrane protein assembly factor BamB
MSAEGHIHCLSTKNGQMVWNVDTREVYGAGKGFFGMACSPLVVHDLVLINIGGGDGAGIIALDKATGKLRWKATSDEASYSSPTIAHINGDEQALFLTRSGLVSLNLTNGFLNYQFPWRSPMGPSVNAATPLVINGMVFLSASYDTGAVLLRVKNRKPEVIWSGDDQLSNHYATSIHHDGYLYGFHGRQEQGPSLVCVQLMTGKRMWSQDRFGAGTLMVSGDKLLIMAESGELVLAQASPQKYQELNRAQVLGRGVRAYPACADGQFFARSKDMLVCLDLK